MVWGSAWVSGWRHWRRWLTSIDHGLARGWLSWGGASAWTDLPSEPEVAASEAAMPAGVVELWGREDVGKSQQAFAMACDFAANGGLVAYVELHGVLDGVVFSPRSARCMDPEPGRELQPCCSDESGPPCVSSPMVMLRPRDGDQAVAMMEAFLAQPLPSLIVVDHLDVLISDRELSMAWGELTPWQQERREVWSLDALLRLDRAARASGSTVLVVRQSAGGALGQDDGRFLGVQALARVARRRLEVTAGATHRSPPNEDAP